jgi:hypothetical protein
MREAPIMACKYAAQLLHTIGPVRSVPICVDSAICFRKATFRIGRACAAQHQFICKPRPASMSGNRHFRLESPESPADRLAEALAGMMKKSW